MQLDPKLTTVIPNHYSPTLSQLDLMMVRSVPPGGNWKDIPHDIPSKRLEQIRSGYAAGNGSRSTYYGRLSPDAPSYTITTFVNRPGNGCNIHYDFDGGQHRLISLREAARLQSFPDSFIFLGSRASVYRQIGNAVPPLLGFQIARQFGRPGCYVDLFSGAGGLSLGFKQAGWKPLLGNDIDRQFLATYAANIHNGTICGDIRSPEVFGSFVQRAAELRKAYPHDPFMVLGGPPCQGFSTAGKRRSMSDERNQLFQNYVEVLAALNPDGFVFENVPGLLNMERGRVFEEVCSALRGHASHVTVWKLDAHQFAIPQRRKRVLVVGTKGDLHATPPVAITEYPSRPFSGLKPAVTVREALSDLPPLVPGQDGSCMRYVSEPISSYQELMRGRIDIKTFLNAYESQD